MMVSIRRFFVFVGVISLAVPLVSAEPATIRIAQMEGTGSVMQNTELHEAKPGMPCSAGDLLETGTDSQLDLVISNTGGCRFLAGTRVKVNSDAPSNTAFELLEGNAIFNIKPQGEGSMTFVVETLTAIASVRGTQFWGRANQDPSVHLEPMTTFAVREGSVDIEIKATGQKIHLAEKQAIDIPIDPSPLSSRAALPAELAAMAQADQIPT